MVVATAVVVSLSTGPMLVPVEVVAATTVMGVEVSLSTGPILVPVEVE